ncbi:hypothetical protein ES703_61554 [subsurface metagenome]
MKKENKEIDEDEERLQAERDFDSLFEPEDSW